MKGLILGGLSGEIVVFYIVITMVVVVVAVIVHLDYRNSDAVLLNAFHWDSKETHKKKRKENI